MAAKKHRKVPTGRVNRLGRVAGLAGSLAGGMLAEGVRKVRAGEGFKAGDLLLTPANARRVADELANMRGAAMKLGQILSMDTGELLPPEWTEVLARLRSDADAMPPLQLEAQLESALGDEWPELLYDFQYAPIASASIGQVHRAIGPDGKPVALKIQYPGIATSINSDVDNIASVLRLSGVLPDGIDIQPLLDEVKVQLRDEADYRIEAGFLQDYSRRLAGDERFAVPVLYEELSGETVLCMEFMAGDPVESAVQQGAREASRVMEALIDLMFIELFDWNMVQTDPNFANYLYRPDNGNIVLLDFGATRRFKRSFVNQYKRLAKAALDGDRSAMVKAAEKLGYLGKNVASEVREGLLDIFEIGAEPMLLDEPYDFASSDLPGRIQEAGLALQVLIQRDNRGWHNPPVDAMYFHRKIGGMFMLADRMGASVNVHRIVKAYIDA